MLFMDKIVNKNRYENYEFKKKPTVTTVHSHFYGRYAFSFA